MKKLTLLLLLFTSVGYSQITQRCAVCPPSLKGVPSGYVLTDSSGHARWQSVAGFDTTAIGVDSLSKLYWGLTGNSGTDPNVNFIGTTDSVPFRIYNYLNNDNDEFAVNMSGIAGNTQTGGVDILGVGNNGREGIVLDGRSTNSGTALIIHGTSIDNTGADVLIQAENGKFQILLGDEGYGKILTSDSVGNATWSHQILTASDSLDFGNILANGNEVKTIALTGAALSDVVSLGIPNASMNDHASFVAWVSSSDTVSVKCFNFDGSSFDPAKGLFKVQIMK